MIWLYFETSGQYMINLYQVLGLSAHATDVQIRQALNTHAQTLDPKVIKAVNEWLLNPTVRPNYDAKLQAQEPLFFTPPQPIHQNQPSPEPSFNPYQSPNYHSAADEYYTPYLWNPNKATFIALIFCTYCHLYARSKLAGIGRI